MAGYNPYKRFHRKKKVNDGAAPTARFGNSKNKYHNNKVTVDGIVFDSKREAKRYTQLKERLDAGEISNLDRQVKYILIPAQREPDTVGPKGGVHRGKLIERECAYVADFVYNDDFAEDSEEYKERTEQNDE